MGMGKDVEAGAFDLSGSIGVLTNITLKGWRSGGEIYSGRLFGGKGYGGEKGGGEEKGGEGGEMGRGRGREGEGEGEGIEGSISVSESHFSSFCVSSAPFLSSPSIPLMSLSKLTFFNISTANEACSPSTTTSSQTSCFMSSCSFSSVCDAYDGGIVTSLNNPFASLTASNTSFVGCCRTRNVVCEGTSDRKLTPGRQNETENGANSFTWCEWNGSKANGSKDDYADEASNGGAIRMYNLNSGELIVSHCLFNDCYAHYAGGGVMCFGISSVEIEHSFFNSCEGQNRYGGGMFVYTISSCVRISRCEFLNCKSNEAGGGLYLNDFKVSGTGCIGEENEGGESACVFDCSFTSCSITNDWGGGMFCKNVPNQFKIRSVRFISCNASTRGGGFHLEPIKQTVPADGLYCYFLFFHECKCSGDPPHGHDMIYLDNYNHYLKSGNPFKECYTTNTDDQRVCYAYNYASAKAWSYNQTSKKVWLNEWSKVLFVGVNGKDSSGLCGMGESAPCKTVGHAVETGLEELSSSITLMEGNHTSEATTIDIGEKKISVIGKGKDKSSIGTGTLSSVGTLFSVSTGHLGLLHMKVDCNSNSSPSPSVVVVSDGGGSLSLEDVVITTSVSSGNYVMSSSVFVVPLSQLSMVDVEITDMNVSKSLFSESDLSSPSSSSLSSLSSFSLTSSSSSSSSTSLSSSPPPALFSTLLPFLLRKQFHQR